MCVCVCVYVCVYVCVCVALAHTFRRKLQVVEVPVYSNVTVPVSHQAQAYQAGGQTAAYQAGLASTSSSQVSQSYGFQGVSGVAMQTSYSSAGLRSSGEKMVGLGMQLTRGTRSGHVRVTEVVPGYAAYNSGQIKVGDTLEEVDGVALEQVDMGDIDKYCLGPAGSSASLLIRRGHQTFGVNLIRCVPGHLSTWEPARILSGGSAGFPSLSL